MIEFFAKVAGRQEAEYTASDRVMYWLRPSDMIRLCDAIKYNFLFPAVDPKNGANGENLLQQK